MHNALFSIPEKIILAVLTITTFFSFGYELYRRISIIFKGTGSLPFDRIGERLFRVFREVFLHEKVIRERPYPGVMHALVFWGFLVFGLITLDHFSTGFYHPLLSDSTHRFYSYLVIPFSFLVIFGICALAYRRFVTKPKSLGDISLSSGLVAVFIVVLMVTYLVGEMNIDPLIWKINWWIHSLIILGFLLLIPRSKHLHLVLGPVNIFFRPFDQPEHSPVNFDLEGEEEDLVKMLLDLNKLSQNASTRS